jgi:nucleotide-binding universal stress UspA family protein
MRAVIALDGSKAAERAVERVAGWAFEAKAEVTLLSVVHPDNIHETPEPARVVYSMTPAGNSTLPTLSVPEPAVRLAEDRSQALVRARTERADYMRGLADRLLTGVEVRITVLETSDRVAKSIVEYAAFAEADLIAMATRGRHGLGRALLGSVSEQVVREATVPVLLIGPAV